VQRFERIESAAAPLLLRDVDTDVIIPMRRLAQPAAGELGRYAFEALRYGPEGADGPENPDFVLNRPEYRGAEILLADENFGCGSSREPAVVPRRDRLDLPRAHGRSRSRRRRARRPRLACATDLQHIEGTCRIRHPADPGTATDPRGALG
jgi:hypothetical protein